MFEVVCFLKSWFACEKELMFIFFIFFGGVAHTHSLSLYPLPLSRSHPSPLPLYPLSLHTKNPTLSYTQQVKLTLSPPFSPNRKSTEKTLKRVHGKEASEGHWASEGMGSIGTESSGRKRKGKVEKEAKVGTEGKEGKMGTEGKEVKTGVESSGRKKKGGLLEGAVGGGAVSG